MTFRVVERYADTRSEEGVHIPVPMVGDEPNTYHTMGTTIAYSSMVVLQVQVKPKIKAGKHFNFGRTR